MNLTGGLTSLSIPIYVQNSAAGGGLGGLVFGSSGLVAEYRRAGQASWTSITLQTMTLGTWVTGGFIADGSLSGAYELGVPNAAVAAGVVWVAIRLYGAANMTPVLERITLTALSLSGALAAPRALDAIADNALTVNDALHCGIAAAAGKETVVGTAYTVKTPSTGTVLRIFTLDSATAPTSRT